MTRIGFNIILFVMWLGTVLAASQFGPAFEQAKAGRPIEECFAHIDLAKIDLAEETPAILDVLRGNNLLLARRAAGAALAVLLLRPDAKTKNDARALVPALITHYDDPDPDQPSTVDAPTDSWKQAIMYFLINSDAVPPTELINKMQTDLNRTGDAYSLTAKVAAAALSHLRPLPQGVLDALLAKMYQSPRARIEVIEVLGANHVNDPRVIRNIALALEGHADGNPLPGEPLASDTGTQQNTNELRRVAARALGQIGPSAKDALPPLRRIAGSTDPAIEEDTREAARQAIRLIDDLL
jgi:hypothetical protein